MLKGQRTKRNKIARILKLKEEVRSKYQEIDRLTNELASSMKVDELIRVNGRLYTLTDHFAGANVRFRATAFRRHEIVEYKERKK